MKRLSVASILFSVALLFISCGVSFAQTSPNVENGFKPYGSYDGSHLDTVNLMNGNLMLHVPLLPTYSQRGDFTPQYSLYMTSKNWSVSQTPVQGQSPVYSWQLTPQGVTLISNVSLTLHRTINQFFSGTGETTYMMQNFSLTGPDGSAHHFFGIPGKPLAPTGDPTVHETLDGSAYNLVMSSPDSNGVLSGFAITDRNGVQYQGTFPTDGSYLTTAKCKAGQFTLPFGGSHAQLVDDQSYGTSSCPQTAYPTIATDSNGNQINIVPLGQQFATWPGTDTLGRAMPFAFTPTNPGTVDTSKCVSLSGLPIVYADLLYYNAPDGTTRSIQRCYANLPIQTAFGVSGVVEAPNGFAPSPQQLLVTVVLADNTKWTFDYDGYANLKYVGLPTGGSISYTWTTIAIPPCSGSYTSVSRAVQYRILADNNGNSAKWSYSWSGSGTTLTNTVSDPAGNDTVHVFTALAGCAYFETSTRYYQGPQGGQPIKQVDTGYTTNYIAGDDGKLGNILPVSIKTTVNPSGKVSLITKQYDSGYGTGTPMFGNVVKEQEFDWGAGNPGALLRETDTVFKWQKDSGYLNANLVDLPASNVVVSPGTNAKSGCPVTPTTTSSCMAETDYAYDEPLYLTIPSPVVSVQHVTPPNGVRGNLSTTSSWLSSPISSFVTSHTNWYDTGEPYQKIDPLLHTTTLSYDPAYLGAYVTQTCLPTTNGVTHCSSGTYDLNTGVLNSLTDQNGQTSNYAYDYMFHIASAQAPPDPANGNMRATNSFNYSNITAPGSFPLTMTRVKSVTTTLSDSVTGTYDGLGRSITTQHAIPGSGPAMVATSYDDRDDNVTVTNPYFATSDSTYGTTTTHADALGRPLTITEQDGSVKSVSYDVAVPDGALGTCNVTKDEAGNQRRSCSDALGRLVEVDEPGVVNNAVANNFLAMQTDGNLVIYDPHGTAEWNNFMARGSGIYLLRIQNDGNVIEYGPYWNTGTVQAAGSGTVTGCSGSTLEGGQALFAGSCLLSNNRRFVLSMQTDGNLVLYDSIVSPWRVLWTTGTSGRSVSYATIQKNGNLVLYGPPPSNTPVWSSATATALGNFMLWLQDDGNLVIYNGLWATNTPQTSFTTAGALSCNVGNVLNMGQNLAMGGCMVSPSGQFELAMQTDGNLALYDRSVNPPAILWNAGTAMLPTDPRVAFQTLYFYDALGNLLCVEQHGNVSGTGCSASPASDATSPWRVRRFTYDSLSRLLTASNPESNSAKDINGNPVRVPTVYSYDADGNLLQKTSPAHNQGGTATQAISYCYDELHRVTAKDYQPHIYTPPNCPITAPVVSYTYDSGAFAKGKLTSLTDQAGTAAYTYDNLGRMASETRVIAGVSKPVSYEYNLDGSLAKLHYPSGRVVTYTPDAAGRIISAADSNGTQYVSSATYYANGSEYQRSMPGIYFRNDLNQRLQVSGFYSDNTVVGSYFMNKTYNYGALHQNNGNISSIVDNRDATRTQTFTYDSLNRITSGYSAAASGTYSWGETYSIDPWGNLNIAPMGNKAHGGFFNNASDINNHALGFVFDAAGNLTNTTQYVYDPENRIQVTAGTAYTYDADGQRVLKSNSNTGAALKSYWMGNGNVLAEADGSGSLTAEYVYFKGKRIARIDLPANTVHYYLSDHLGSSTKIVSAAGVVEEESDFTAFGSELSATSGPNHYKFTSKERDSESQLDYFGARYYSNLMGRFMTPDWAEKATAVPYAEFADPQSLNLYTYVRNLPTVKTDLDGHCPDLCIVEAVVVTALATATIAAVHNFNNYLRSADGQANVHAIGSAISNAFHSSSNADKSSPAPPPVATQPGQKDADFVVTPAGTAVATDPGRVRDSLSGAPGVTTKPADSPSGSETGTIHTGVQTKNGPVDVRAMDGSKTHGPRTVITHPGTNNPKTPDGKATNDKNDNHIPNDHKRPGSN